jgi:hypothetical protein
MLDIQTFSISEFFQKHAIDELLDLDDADLVEMCHELQIVRGYKDGTRSLDLCCGRIIELSIKFYDLDKFEQLAYELMEICRIDG